MRQTVFQRVESFAACVKTRRLSPAKIVVPKSKCPGYTSFLQMNP